MVTCGACDHGDVASRGEGQMGRVPLDNEQFARNREKSGKIREKKEIEKKRQISGSFFFHFEIRLATLLSRAVVH